MVSNIAMTNLVARFLCACALVLAFGITVGHAAELKRDILGLRVDMPKAEVQKRLQVIGKFVRDERKRQEIWEVRDASFSHVVVGFDGKDTLRFVTAVAREDKEAKRVAYNDIAATAHAHQAGDPAINNFNFEWRLAAHKGEPEALVIARGRDPKFLSTYSLKRLSEDAGAEEEND